MRLFQYVYIDEFTADKDGIYILTHWHQDHIKGLTSTFRFPIYCTDMTANMLDKNYPNVRTIRVKYNEKIGRIRERIIVLDANHLPGSIMLYFPSRSCLYTGDYRLSSYMLDTLKMTVGTVDTLYVDGTFHHPSIRFISKTSSVSLLENFINMYPTGTIAIGMYHVGICALLVDAGIKFAIDKSISTSTQDAIYNMFIDNIAVSSRFVIVQPRKFKNVYKCPILIPSALWYCCKGNMKYVNTIIYDTTNKWRINFTCHSDYYDNMMLSRLLNTNTVIHLGKINVYLPCS